ncbi:MAG: transcription termination factor NusA [Rickettsiales bacterium]|jgi:N utilization substance protein A|nr:transcription termination factor NusA [Rickettsiales bacterium]
MTDVVRGSRELLLVMEGLASDKGIDVNSVLGAMEEGIKLAARRKYGSDLAVECNIDRRTGDIRLYSVLEVVEDRNAAGLDNKIQVALADAVAMVKNNRAVFQETIEVGKTIRIELPPVDMNRVVAQIAKNEIIKKIKEAEKEKEYNEFINKVGTVVSGVVKRTGLRNIVVEVDGYETLLSKDNLIPGEYFRVGDRLKAYVTDVIRGNDNQMFLSRVDNNFLVELMKQEISEMYDGLIEAKGVARDAGSKAKVVVYSRDNLGDVVGICVGPRGCKIQAVSSELRGEKIDVIRWSEDRAELVANLLSPAKVNKVIVNDNLGLIDVVLSKDQLNLAIGRGGQNIRLASRIAGGRINIMTEEEEKQKRSAEFSNTTALFVNALDVEEVIAQLLIAYGYSTVEELATASVERLKRIEGFDEDIAAEIKSRAEEYVENPEGFVEADDDGEPEGEAEGGEENEENGEIAAASGDPGPGDGELAPEQEN